MSLQTPIDTAQLNTIEPMNDLLASFFLRRLSSLVVRQDRATTHQEQLALAHAAFSTYLDCVELGLEDAARRILERDLLVLPLESPQVAVAVVAS